MFSNESYRAVRQGAAFVHRTDRGVIRVRGADGAAWLQGLLTNDIETLKPIDPAAGEPGEARYTAYLTPQGRMITDARVVRLRDHILLDVPASLTAALVQRLDALIFAEDAHLEDASSGLAIVDVYGPETARALQAVFDAAEKVGVVVIAEDDDLFGVRGYALYVDAASLAHVEATLVAAGAVPVDLETLEVVRIEAARPAFLVDMDTDTIPLEAGIEDRAISFTKGCYVGQEIIVRVTQRGGGRVARRLVGLEMAANGGPAVASAKEDASGTPLVPARGAVIRAGDRDIGRITSAAFSPALARTIALGYVHRDFVEPGTAVTVMSDDGPHDARVTRTPFVERS